MLVDLSSLTFVCIKLESAWYSFPFKSVC